jgi:hypothetical protein
MGSFEKELLKRSPLAACVLEAGDYLFDQELLDGIWERYRGRCYQDVLSFEQLLQLTRDALVRHGGSAHRLFLDLEREDEHPVDESNFYRKLANMPVELSRGLLRECTARLRGLLPPGAGGRELPGCFDGFTLVAGDGKKIKNATKRLKPTRGYSGGLAGAKALVAMDLRGGMALAMSDSLDGLTNDVPLVPALMEQLRDVVSGPMLSVWDRQFDDVKTLAHLCRRPGDAYVVRMNPKYAFETESVVEKTDAKGRLIRDEIGTLVKGKGKACVRVKVRRVTLFRPGEEDVILLSNLLDRDAFPAEDLLELYRHRWDIERLFQQVTETFSLEHLIGCEPRAVLFQFAYCLLLYNLVQLIKLYVAQDGGVLAEVVSTFYLFNDIRRELEAWAYHGGPWTRRRRDANQMRSRLGELLEGSWDPIAYTKASDKKPRPKRPPPLRLHGGHSSVQRLLEGRAKVIKA